MNQTKPNYSVISPARHYCDDFERACSHFFQSNQSFTIIKMAASATCDILKELSSITKCSVCCETFNDPRQLPCIHTYCLKCIRGFTKDNQPGDDIPCPPCRKGFTIPEGGIRCSPKNVVVEQLKDVGHRSSTHCEVCSAEGTDVAAKSKKPASMFCVECCERQCEACAAIHRQMKVSRDHNLIN